MVTVVAGVGVRGYLGREVAIYPERGPAHLGAALAIRGVAGVVVLAGTVTVVLLARPGFGSTLVVLAAVSQLATLLYTTMWLSFEAHERLQYIVYAELGSRVFVIALASCLLALGAGVVAAAAVFMLGNIVELAITYGSIRLRFYRPEFSASAADLLRIARLSLPIGMLAALYGALQQIDRVLLRVLCDEEAVGIYSAAWVLSDNFRMISDLFLGASFAAGMRLYARDRAAFEGLYRSSMTVAALLGLPVAAGAVVIAPDLIALVYRSGSYAPAGTVLRILVCDVPITFAFQVGTLPLLAARREVVMVKLLLAALAANVALDLVLVPRFRAPGAALATLTVSAGALIASWALTRSWIRLVEVRRIASIALATAVMTAAAYGARLVAGMWAAVAVGAAVYVALLLGLRAVCVGDLRELLRRRVPAPVAPAA
jgi:O-antigen/teichoic acid export membrane protein